MTPVALLKWQWNGYPRYHQSRANLLLHILVVPLFLAGNVGVVAGSLQGSLVGAGMGVTAMVASLGFQGIGHRMEPIPPEPFTSRANAVGRILLEQWVTFPRFVISGGWWQALLASGSGPKVS
jgi:hypothetical protein